VAQGKPEVAVMAEIVKLDDERDRLQMEKALRVLDRFPPEVIERAMNRLERAMWNWMSVGYDTNPRRIRWQKHLQQ
jgi:hypothetical protein